MQCPIAGLFRNTLPITHQLPIRRSANYTEVLLGEEHNRTWKLQGVTDKTGSLMYQPIYPKCKLDASGLRCFALSNSEEASV